MEANYNKVKLNGVCLKKQFEKKLINKCKQTAPYANREAGR